MLNSRVSRFTRTSPVTEVSMELVSGAQIGKVRTIYKLNTIPDLQPISQT